ncbi:MAG TPA: HIT family protein [Acidimicrobiales bacterium]|nr:HIT family protein [Acidimicrobiales bacterium]
MSGAPCVFDALIAGERPAHLVLDEPDLVAFLDHRPVFPGHVLVLPRRHLETLADVPEALLGPLLGAGRRIAAAQRAALGNQGTWLALNDVVSQSVPHVHLHVVPRRPKDGLRGFFWPRSRYADDQEAAAVAAQLRGALEALAPGAR